MKQIFINIWNVLIREVKLILSRPLYLSSSVGAVMISMFFYMTLMEGGVAEEMPIAVVDMDQTSISRRLIHEMQATPSVDVKIITNSFPEAREAMQQGKIYGIFVVPEGFYRDIASFKRPRMDFYITNAYTLGGNTAYKQMITVANLVSGAFQREVLRKKGMPEGVILKRIQPVKIEGHMLSNPWGNYTIYLVSTIMPGVIGLIALMLTIYSIGSELKNRTSNEWLELAGDNYTVAMIGKLIPYTLIYQVLGIACHIILYNVADFPVQGSYARLFLGMLLFIMAMEIMGIVIIGCIPILRDSLSVGALYAMLGFSLSGFTYPNMAMLPFVRALSYLEPLRHYYLIYVNEALLGAPAINSTPPALALAAFIIPALAVAPRLHHALLYQNFRLK